MDANPTAESLLSLATWAIWGLVGLCALFYFASSYLFEILAQKHEEPRWMAWVPIANGLLMMRLVGWGRWFWVALAAYAVALGGMLLPGALKLLGMVVIVPLALGMLVLGLVYFPVLATRRGLGVGVGLWMVVPQFVPPFVEASLPGAGVWVSLAASVAAAAAFLWIVFHDGGPLHGPHPLGYALTALAVLGLGLALQTLPARLAQWAQEPEFQEAWARLGSGLGGSAPEGGAEASAASQVVLEAAAGSPLDTPPAPADIARACPPDTRERSGPEGRGRARWCEKEVDGRFVRHGPARTWHDNGYLESEGVYDHGRRTGTWSRYWRSGGRRVQAEFRDGVQHGWMHRWDAHGNLETAVRYANGEVALR